MSDAGGFIASRVKVVCLVVVVVGCIAGTLGAGRSDLAVMLGIFGLALFVGLELVPMAKVSSSVRLPTWFSALFVLQAVAIGLFPLLQPVQGGGQTGPHVGIAGLLGHGAVGAGGTAPYQVLALLVLVLAVSCCLAGFVALRREARRPDWVRPPRGAIGFYAEGQDPRDRGE